MEFLASEIRQIKKRNNLSPPVVLPSLYLVQGAKFDLTSILSQNFQVGHSFAWGSSQAAPSYSLSTGFQNNKFMMYGLVDDQGTLQGRAYYNWGVDQKAPAEAEKEKPEKESKHSSKVQMQLGAQSMVQLEQDFTGETMQSTQTQYIVNFLTPATTTGIFSFSALQSISESSCVGAEVVVQRLQPREPAQVTTTYAYKYAPKPTSELPQPTSIPAGSQSPSPYMPINPKDPHQSFTLSVIPATGIYQATYWRRLNQRLEACAEVQMLIGEGRREGVANIGFKLDTLYATFRGMVDTLGKVSAVLEERMAPGLNFQISAEMDYSKGGGGQGKVGVGFVLEA